MFFDDYVSLFNFQLRIVKGRVYKVTVDDQILFIDFRCDSVWNDTGDLEIRKNEDYTYTWHGRRQTFTEEGETVVFSSTEYNIWDMFTHLNNTYEDFDQSLSTPTNFSLDFYPVGTEGYGVPELSWDNSDSFAEYELERSFTCLFNEPDRRVIKRPSLIMRSGFILTRI